MAEALRQREGGDPGLRHLPGALRSEREDRRGRGVQHVHHRRDDAESGESGEPVT